MIMKNEKFSASFPLLSKYAVCQEKVRRSPNDFVRNGNERERERGGGGVDADLA